MTSKDQRRAWVLTKLLVGEVTTAEAAAREIAIFVDQRGSSAAHEMAFVTLGPLV